MMVRQVYNTCSQLMMIIKTAKMGQANPERSDFKLAVVVNKK